MAVQVDIIARKALGGVVTTFADLTFDSAYPPGGEAITPAQVGLGNIHQVIPGTSAGYLCDWDYVADKMKVLTPVAAASAHTHAATAKTFIYPHSGKDIKGSANTDSENADAASLPTNGALVGAETAVAGEAYVFPATAHPDQGRNVCIVFHNDSGGALNLFEGVMTFTVTGTWRGAAQTTTITFTSTAGNKAIANTKFRYKYGNKPFDTVPTVTVDNICDNGLKIAVGLGSKIGLPMDLKTPAEADVIKITKTAAHLAATGIVDTTNMTVNLGTLADGNDFLILYRVTDYISAIASGGAVSAAVAPEVANDTNLSALTVRCQFIGV